MNRSHSIFGIALAILLVVCLSVSAISEEERGVPENFKAEPNAVVFNSSAFQSGIRGEKGLEVVAKEHSTIGDQAVSFGFAAKSDEAKFFIIGTLYSEALAYASGGNLDLAAKRLEAIEKEFINLGVPASLFNYISKTRNMVETKRYPKEVLLEFLSLFQPFFEDYSRGESEDKLVLFRSGSWLTDYTLSAAAGDKQLLKQPSKVEYLLEEMKRMDAPKGVLQALGEIAEIAKKEEITDRDVKDVLKQVKKIQTILG